MAISELDLQEALDNCAAEPVHIPGVVQPMGCLLGVHSETGQIDYASANTADILGLPVDRLLGQSFRSQCGRDVAHAVQNAAYQPRFQDQPIPLGLFKINERPVYGYASAAKNQSYHLIECEAATETPQSSGEQFETLNFLIESIHACDSQEALFALSVDLMRQLTGYDRVMIYRFDLDYNGEIVAENKRAKLETFMGLRFPSYDIPAQARAIMAKLPLRFISDVKQVHVALLGKDTSLAPLNLTNAYTRGVSPVHLEYLTNMGVQSSMTLSIVVDDALWGMISFHHQRPKTPHADVRGVLTQFANVFSSKLGALRQKELLEQVKDVEELKDQLLLEIDEDDDQDSFFDKIGPRVSQVVPCGGVAVKTEKQVRRFGTLPPNQVLFALEDKARAQDGDILKLESLAETLPTLGSHLNVAGGVLVYVINPDRAIFFFREELASDIHWAGNPDKTVETVSGRLRLAPRGSFSTYIQQVTGACAPWTDDDVFFARRLGAIVNSAERRDVLQTMTRQQSIMIDELNHRVRNILALVRSISQQSRRNHQTLESYAGSFDARIRALASAHDISLGSSISDLRLKQLIKSEFQPYIKDDIGRATFNGPDPAVKTDVAPVLSLVVHELTTNAAKYGALSIETGHIDVDVTKTNSGYTITWQETGGPPIKEPEEKGFGSTLIEEAIPHELKGTSRLTFMPSGVRADISLPEDVFDIDVSAPGSEGDQAETDVSSDSGAQDDVPLSAAETHFPDRARAGTALVLEDDFFVAKELRDTLSEFGFAEVVPLSNVRAVLEFLETETPTVAVLDVSLGRKENSAAAAFRLLDLGVPFVFVTGFGSRGDLPEALDHIPRLRKPVDRQDLFRTMIALFQSQ